MIKAHDAFFMGTAIYLEVEPGKMRKLSRLVSAKARTDGTVDIHTLNNHYCSTFSNDTTRNRFTATCETMGRLAIC
jgi:hypothetical protein